jgi:hypothetical protein
MDFGNPTSWHVILMSSDRRQENRISGNAIAENAVISQLFQCGTFISKYLQEGFIKAF